MGRLMMVTLDNQNKRMLQYESLSYCDIFHFVTTRNGGFSRENYASFNLSPFSGDNMSDVERNREILFGYMEGELVLPYQTHEDKVCILDESWLTMNEEAKQLKLHGVDALVTSLPSLCIGVSTADCVPVLFYDPTRKVVGAAHAGWRGTVKHIVSKTIEIMIELGSNPANIKVTIGPSISQKHFEVGDEVVEAFRSAGFEDSKIIVRNRLSGKAHIDLWEANRIDLINSGVLPGNIEVAGICTIEHNKEFFSARTLGIKSGRIVSGIMIKP